MITKLGKLKNVRFGFGGYQDTQFGLSVTISGKGLSVEDFRGHWAMERTEGTKWTEEDRRNELADMAFYVRDLLKDAGKMSVDELNGIPVEVTLEGNKLKSWRILTEVL